MRRLGFAGAAAALRARHLLATGTTATNASPSSTRGLGVHHVHHELIRRIPNQAI
jgi:hypothetical protein